jgi:iron complex outermembrane receptor protein
MTDMDWLLNAHGSRLDEQSNLGQVIGTGFTPGIGGTSFGGVAGNRGPQLGYWEPDQKQEFEALCQPDPVTGACANSAAPEELARNLAENRPLDTRPYRGDFNRVGQTKLDTWGAFLRGDIDIAGMAFTTLSAYDAYDRSRDSDIDATPERLLETLDVDRAWQFWQQLQLEGELEDHPLRWEVGGYYLMENLDVDAITRVDFEVFNIRRQYSQKIWSLGFWGEFSWDFLDDFTLEGGIRYNWEKKDFDYSRSQIGPPQTTSQSVSWSVPTGEITLRYRFNDEVAAYAGYSRGFKAGHFNALAARDVDQPPADPEFNDAFEVGLRGTWLDGRVTAGSSFFYYLYTDYQVFLFTDEPLSSPVLAILNADQAENYGAELDARIEPLLGWAPAEWEGLVLIGRFGWLHGEFIDFNNVRNVQASNGDIVPQVVDFTGNQLQNAPEYKVSATVEWTFDLARWGQVVPRYDFAWTDDAFFDPNNGRGTAGNLPDFAIGQAAFALHNLRLSYRTPGGNIEVAFWARNLTDQAYKTFAFDVSSFQQFVINFAGKPRTIGMDVSIAF